MSAIETVCARCGTTFIATRRTARYCGERCRRAAYAEKRRSASQAEPDPDQLRRSSDDVAVGDAEERNEEGIGAAAVVRDAGVDQPQLEQSQVGPQPQIVAPKRRPLAAAGGFIVVPPVMFVLGLLLIAFGQLVAGLIEVAFAAALIGGFYVWGSRRQSTVADGEQHAFFGR